MCPSSYWNGWRGAEVLLPDPCQWTQANQPWQGSWSHQRPQGQKGSGPKQYPEKGLEASSPASGIPFVQVFNAVLCTHHFPTVWKHAPVISILKTGKHPALPSFYWPISLLVTTDKLFEKILLTRKLYEVSECGLMQDEQFGFRPRHITFLQLAYLVERITRNFVGKRPKGAVLYYYLFVTCNWVVTWWQESVTLVHVISRSANCSFIYEWVELHGKHVEATWKWGNHPSIYSGTQGNQEKPVSRWPVTRPSSSWLIASLLAYSGNS